MAPFVQKALVIPEPKAPWKLVTDWPVPTPGPNEVLVRVVAAAINPADHYVQEFAPSWIGSDYPLICGYDGSGIIEEVGSEIQGFTKGDKVFFPGGADKFHTTFQEYSLVSADNMAKIPDNISFDQAATLPLCLATAVVGLWNHHPEGQTVGFPAPWEEGGTTKFAGQAAFILGGASNVGQFAIQMAKLQGFSPIITTASLRHEAWLKSLGATHVIDRSLSPDAILAALPGITGDKPVVYAMDAIARTPETQHLAYDAVAPDGALVVVNPQSEEMLAEKVARDGGSKKIARPFASLDIPPNKKIGQELYAHLTEWLEKGILVPSRVQVITRGLQGIPEACGLLKDWKVSGVKLVVHVQETA